MNRLTIRRLWFGPWGARGDRLQFGVRDAGAAKTFAPAVATNGGGNAP